MSCPGAPYLKSSPRWFIECTWCTRKGRPELVGKGRAMRHCPWTGLTAQRAAMLPPLTKTCTSPQRLCGWLMWAGQSQPEWGQCSGASRLGGVFPAFTGDAWFCSRIHCLYSLCLVQWLWPSSECSCSLLCVCVWVPVGIEKHYNILDNVVPLKALCQNV